MILTDPEWQAVLLSLKVSSLAVLFSLPFGIFCLVTGALHVSGKALLDSVLHLPLVLPPVVVGYLLLVSMDGAGLSVNVCMTGLALPSPLAGAARFSLPPSCRFR